MTSSGLTAHTPSRNEICIPSIPFSVCVSSKLSYISAYGLDLLGNAFFLLRCCFSTLVNEGRWEVGAFFSCAGVAQKRPRSSETSHNELTQCEETERRNAPSDRATEGDRG